MVTAQLKKSAEQIATPSLGIERPGLDCNENP